MRLCGVDFETTGLDVRECRIVEIGAVLWDTDLAQPLKMYSAFVDPMFDVTPEIVGLTGITNEMIQEFAANEIDAMTRLSEIMAEGEYAVAHYAQDFDRPVFAAASCRALGLEWAGSQWIDTSIDIVYPPHIKTRNLKHLAAEHGFLNPFPHRALFDVMTMLTILQQYPLDAIIARSKEPTVFLQAYVEFKEKDKAKERGFRWAPQSKIWWKSMKASDVNAEVEACDFGVGPLTGQPE